MIDSCHNLFSQELEQSVMILMIMMMIMMER